MKKIIKLTESDLYRIVKRVISEADVANANISGVIPNIGCNVVVTANYDLKNFEGKRVLYLTPSSVVLNTSLVEIPETDKKASLQVVQNKINVKLPIPPQIQIPPISIESLTPSFQKLFTTIPIPLEKNGELGKEFATDKLPDDSTKLGEWIRSRKWFLNFVQKLGNSFLNQKFKDLPINLDKPKIQQKFLGDLMFEVTLSLLLKNAQITNLTADNVTITANLNLGVTYNSNIPKDPNKASELVANKLGEKAAKNLNLANLNLPGFSLGSK